MGVIAQDQVSPGPGQAAGQVSLLFVGGVPVLPAPVHVHCHQVCSCVPGGGDIAQNGVGEIKVIGAAVKVKKWNIVYRVLITGGNGNAVGGVGVG